ncbi:protein SLOW GREEN 1, chloroplastic-like [Primulina huaijiensis]|uniref:protein SLOW GREEN 1, chloroplastic-like n=1 Tax=Primulina huaijiensis TaxID=1492673 RepID=UPI003CC78B3F
MATLNLTAAKATRRHQPHITSTYLRPSSFTVPCYSLSFGTPAPPLPLLFHAPIKAAFQHSKCTNPDNPEPFLKFQTKPRKTPGIPLNPILAPLKATLIATVTAAALFISQFHFVLKPAISAPVFPPSTVDSSTKDAVADEERERSIEEHLISNPYDIDGLKDLMEIKIKSKKIPEAVEILDKLIDLDPDEKEWPMLKAHLYAYSGDTESAKNGFTELLKKDPFSVEAYHGLVTVASQDDSSEELETIEKKVEDAMNMCKKENKKTDVRDFKLLLAQIRVLEGRYETALKTYQELVKEEPRDFRPYLCQGIIYTLLRKNSEAEKSFEKYRRLVPKGHPYASYFDDNMIATKVFAQKLENERATAKS